MSDHPDSSDLLVPAPQSTENEMTSVVDVPVLAPTPPTSDPDKASPSLPPSPPGSAHGTRPEAWPVPRTLTAARVGPAPHVV